MNGLEIDMLSVGDADAIAVHTVSPEFVAIIDGGYEEDGNKLVDLVRQRYHRDWIDLVVSTHPDNDHIQGLFTVINSIPVGHVWVHDPWNHIDGGDLQTLLFECKQDEEAKRIADAIETASQFIALVDKTGIPRSEPFFGESFGPLEVLGPSQEFYLSKYQAGCADLNSLVYNQKLAAIEDYLLESGFGTQTHMQATAATVSVLDEKDDPSPINQSSVICRLYYGTNQHLFTGDAGVEALMDARSHTNFGNTAWLDVPHHGSKRNLSNELIDYLAPPVSYISAKGSRKHPSRAVVNALKRHGNVYSTHNNGNLLYSMGNIPARDDYSPAEPL